MHPTIHITSSLEWHLADGQMLALIRKIKDAKYRKDAQRMMDNIVPMVTKLSQLELQQRRSPSQSTRLVDEQLLAINNALSEIDQWIILSLLA